jgi:hypothetical protein
MQGGTMKNLHLVCCILLASSLASGCSRKSEESARAAKSKVQSESRTKSSGNTEAADSKSLAGVWYGSGGFNEKLVAAKMRSMGPVQAVQLQQIARDLLATEIAISFAADGSLEMDIEIEHVDKPKLKEGARGRWKLLSQNGDDVVVQVTLNQLDGSTQTNELKFQFVNDANHLAMVAPVGPELSDCEPVFVFRRTDITEVASVPEGLLKK